MKPDADIIREKLADIAELKSIDYSEDHPFNIKADTSHLGCAFMLLMLHSAYFVPQAPERSTEHLEARLIANSIAHTPYIDLTTFNQKSFWHFLKDYYTNPSQYLSAKQSTFFQAPPVSLQQRLEMIAGNLQQLQNATQQSNLTVRLKANILYLIFRIGQAQYYESKGGLRILALPDAGKYKELFIKLAVFRQARDILRHPDSKKIKIVNTLTFIDNLFNYIMTTIDASPANKLDDIIRQFSTYKADIITKIDIEKKQFGQFSALASNQIDEKQKPDLNKLKSDLNAKISQLLSAISLLPDKLKDGTEFKKYMVLFSKQVKNPKTEVQFKTILKIVHIFITRVHATYLIESIIEGDNLLTHYHIEQFAELMLKTKSFGHDIFSKTISKFTGELTSGFPLIYLIYFQADLNLIKLTVQKIQELLPPKEQNQILTQDWIYFIIELWPRIYEKDTENVMIDYIEYFYSINLAPSTTSNPREHLAHPIYKLYKKIGYISENTINRLLSIVFQYPCALPYLPGRKPRQAPNPLNYLMIFSNDLSFLKKTLKVAKQHQPQLLDHPSPLYTGLAKLAPLHLACLLIIANAEQPNSNKAQDKSKIKSTPYEFLKTLIESNVNLNKETSWGETALMLMITSASNQPSFSKCDDSKQHMGNHIKKLKYLLAQPEVDIISPSFHKRRGQLLSPLMTCLLEQYYTGLVLLVNAALQRGPDTLQKLLQSKDIQRIVAIKGIEPKRRVPPRSINAVKLIQHMLKENREIILCLNEISTQYSQHNNDVLDNEIKLLNTILKEKGCLQYITRPEQKQTYSCLSEETPESHYRQARKLLINKKYSLALTHIAKAKQSPSINQALLYFAEGRCKQGLKQFAEAEKLFSTALKVPHKNYPKLDSAIKKRIAQCKSESAKASSPKLESKPQQLKLIPEEPSKTMTKPTPQKHTDEITGTKQEAAPLAADTRPTTQQQNNCSCQFFINTLNSPTTIVAATAVASAAIYYTLS